MADRPTKVLFILGSGRNGSTVLGNILSSGRRDRRVAT